MSKLIEQLRTVGVFNDHGFFNEIGSVWISYTAVDYGRGGRPAYARVYRQGFKTDPDAHWQDHGNKTFGGWEAPRPEGVSNKAHCIALAQAWAGKRYGITEWARTPFGSYGEATFVKARLKELKAEMSRERTSA